MNAVVVLMSSVLMPGADPMPAAQPAPVVVSGQGGCTNCGSGPIPYSTQSKRGLFDKLKGRFAQSPSCDCECPQPAPAPRPNLLDHLKSRYGKKPGPSACGCCDAAPAAVAVPAANPPAEMSKPVDPKPVEPKGKPKAGTESDAIQIPQAPPLPPVGANPGAFVVPQQPVTPVSGPKLNGANSPY